jgi:tRNA(His) 5'-end guanylyltransferase
LTAEDFIGRFKLCSQKKTHKLTVYSFSAKYEFEKPNDVRALDLMNAAAKAVIIELPAIVIAYGVSDEFR